MRRIKNRMCMFSAALCISLLFAGAAQAAEPETPTTEGSDKPADSELQEPQTPAPEGVHHGWYYYNDGWYYYSSEGKLVSGWVKDGGKWYYLESADAQTPYRMLSGCVREIDGHTYFFQKDGVMLTGWITYAGSRYYADPSGAMATGWRKVNGVWYYLDGTDPQVPGAMVSGVRKEIGGDVYFFADSGAMRTGWIQCPEGWYYARSSGAMATGWEKVSGKWYYLDGANEEHPGLMVADCEKEIGGIPYSFTASGAMRAEWQYIDGAWYYYNKDGILQTDWVKVDGKWYYLDPADENRMVADQWKTIRGKRYLFGASGAMKEEWVDQDGWYYFGKDGAMRTGWVKVGVYWYYFYEENDPHGGEWGKMAADTEIDGWRVAPDGRYAEAYKYAKMVLDKVGWNLQAAFDWSKNIPYETNIEVPDPGSDYFAMYGFKNGKGNCYVKATTFYYMADLLGYDVHWMSGFVALRSGGKAAHSWIEIWMDGKTYVYDPSFAGSGGKGYQITYGMSGTYKYIDYRRMN